MSNLSPLISEARARIIWGEECSSVRSFLVSNGISEFEADAKIKEFNVERNNEIRKQAIRQTLIGSVLLIGAALFIYICLKHPSSGLTFTGRYKGLAVVGLIGCYGFYKLVNGIINLAWPQSENESITDME